MLFADWLDNHNQTWDTPHDGCHKCTTSICCVVFSICSPNVWFVKNQGVRCKHLREEWWCKIYENRWEYPWYRESCESFTCHNIWPLLDSWIRKYNISMDESSWLWWILRMMMRFVTTWYRYDERSFFLEKYLLQTYKNSQELIDFFNQPGYQIEHEFHKWIMENPLNTEEDEELRRLFLKD